MPQETMDYLHSIVPHSHQRTGGLFDKGLAGDKTHVTGNDSASDLLSAIDNGSDILNVNVNNFDNISLFGGEMDPFTDASLDSFVDLSQYLMEGSIPETEVMPNTVPVDDGTSARNGVKRKWQDDVDEVVELVEMSPEPVTITTPDHAYSAKKPRLTSASDSDDPLDQSPQPGCSKVDKYRIRREKNNVASKRSREIRKNKFTEMEEKANTLVVENEKMRGRIVELEALAKEMKAVLVARLSGK